LKNCQVNVQGVCPKVPAHGLRKGNTYPNSVVYRCLRSHYIWAITRTFFRVIPSKIPYFH